ncbi:hypothetical protein FFI89_027575 [Bradyrhizobium sp. KBS0727]|uniref:hypothetical protein n=1 Tax=unclassified Bradyrhizobium TaxID=2631580 RepID=UPI00110EA204|nr:MULTISPECIES: hypothetical protein [unclassified Bradyrhizobium]QDW40553.1 hypothetical protein FFI71_027580 [Bradyrhizobium sp. KBS0725]QDW47158.1 hypothetical protein FFI89_027575 [Bradyrhizobium sp. KBS0727]
MSDDAISTDNIENIELLASEPVRFVQVMRGVALQWLADPDAIDLEATIAMATVMIGSQIGGGAPI